jgi:hypothetical protein
VSAENLSVVRTANEAFESGDEVAKGRQSGVVVETEHS